jgi:hypothetical protein
MAPGVRLGAHPDVLMGDLRPDLALGGTRLESCGRPLAHTGRLQAPKLGVGGLGRRCEGLAVARAVPATALDAADRHVELRLRRHQHRHVEGAVLLGAEDLLAVVEQDADVERIGDAEVVDRRAA